MDTSRARRTDHAVSSPYGPTPDLAHLLHGAQPTPHQSVGRTARQERHDGDVARQRPHAYDVRLARELGFITGDPALIAQLTCLLERLAPSDSPLLIEGESGSGKELIAQGAHRASARAGRTLVDVNCAGMRPELLDDFLFGHVPGAFTGAARARMGKLVEAHRGTLFLDELEEMPIDLQVRLLRVLETGTVEPIGGSHADRRKVDVRIVAASNQPLLDLVDSGKLREDLYYRLKCLRIRLPPLRERVGDIRLLADHFLSYFQGDRRLMWTTGALELLEQHSWPGNVRELRRCVEAVCIMTGGPWIEAEVVHACLDHRGPRVRQANTPVHRGEPDLEKSVARTRLDHERLALLRKHRFSPSRCVRDPAYPDNRSNVDRHLRIFLCRALRVCAGDLERAAAVLAGTHARDMTGRLVQRLERFVLTLEARARSEERTALVRSLKRQYCSASEDVLALLDLVM